MAEEVANLLKHGDAKVREAALNALQAIGSALDSALPRLTQHLLEHWATEQDLAVRQALTKVLRSRLMVLKREL